MYNNIAFSGSGGHYTTEIFGAHHSKIIFKENWLITLGWSISFDKSSKSAKKHNLAAKKTHYRFNDDEQMHLSSVIHTENWFFFILKSEKCEKIGLRSSAFVGRNMSLIERIIFSITDFSKMTYLIWERYSKNFWFVFWPRIRSLSSQVPAKI